MDHDATVVAAARRCRLCAEMVPPNFHFCSRCGASIAAPSSGADPLLESVQALFARDLQIERELGRGGMAVVYAALDPALERRVAIKVLLSEMAGDAGMAERFQREARTVAALQHPNVVAIYGVRSDGALTAIVMQYVDGSSLDVVLRESAPLSSRAAGLILAQAAAGLQHAHERGVVHRDVKPANVLLATDGHAVVSDFGIARREGRTRMTASGVIMGSVAYMSPEQASGQQVGPHGDQYSFGVMAYEALTGRLPFTGTVYEILSAHLGTAPPPISDLRPDLPPAIAAWVMRALEKRPEARHPGLKDAERLFGTLVDDSKKATTVVADLAQLRAASKARADANRGADSDATRIAESDATRIAGDDATRVAGSDATRIAGSDATRIAGDDATRIAAKKGSTVIAAVKVPAGAMRAPSRVVAAASTPAAQVQPAASPARTRSRMPAIIAAAAVVVLAAAGITWKSMSGGESATPASAQTTDAAVSPPASAPAAATGTEIPAAPPPSALASPAPASAPQRGTPVVSADAAARRRDSLANVARDSAARAVPPVSRPPVAPPANPPVVAPPVVAPPVAATTPPPVVTPPAPLVSATVADARAVAREFVTMCNQRRARDIELLAVIPGAGDAELRVEFLRLVRSAPDFAAGFDRVASAPIPGANAFGTEFVLDIEWRGGRRLITVQLLATMQGGAWRASGFAVAAGE